MRIAAYNLLKGGTRRVHWIKMIEEHAVDLLLVQESFPYSEHLLPDSYPDAKRRVIWANAGKNAWGSGIYCSIDSVKRIPVPGFEGWVVGAQINASKWSKYSTPLLAFSVHAPSGIGGYCGQVNRLLDAIKKVAKGNEMVIGGDFNILSTHHPELARPVTRRNLGVLHRLEKELQLMNCWQSANPGVIPCQTLRWSGNRAIPYHCDGIFVPQSWQRRLISCEVLSGGDWEVLSDHNPVIASFR